MCMYRVFTVFSTSKDHRQGERAMAGCILIDSDQIQVALVTHVLCMYVLYVYVYWGNLP